MFAARNARWPTRLLVASVGGGCVGGYTTLRQSMVQLNARPAISHSEDSSFRPNRSSYLKQDTVRQISSGSIAG